MAFNDPIAELLTKIRNAKNAQHRYVDLGSSKIKLRILDIMKENGFIENYLVNDEMHLIRVFLRYVKDRKCILNGLTRISSPGGRRYVKAQDIPYVFNGMGLAIVSTCKGIIDGETARNLKVGGELLCTIW
jgi:small subunit ribosomal protein S8